MQSGRQTTKIDRIQTAVRWLLAAVLLTGITWVIFNRGSFHPSAIREVVAGMGLWGPIGFVGL